MYLVWSRFKHAARGHTSQLSVEDSNLVGFVSLLPVNERDDGVVVLHLPIGPLKPALGWSRFKHAVLGTHLSCLGCLFRSVT